MSLSHTEQVSLAAYYCTIYHQLDGLCDIVLHTAEEIANLDLTESRNRDELSLTDKVRELIGGLSVINEGNIFRFARVVLGNVIFEFPEFTSIKNKQEWREDISLILRGKSLVCGLSEIEEEQVYRFARAYLDNVNFAYPEFTIIHDRQEWCEDFAYFLVSGSFRAPMDFGTLLPHPTIDGWLQKSLYESGLILIIPFLFFQNPWCFPLSSERSFVKLIHEHLLFCNSCSFHGLRSFLNDHDIFISESFLEFIVFNDPQLLSVSTRNKGLVERIDTHISDFKLQAKAAPISEIRMLINQKFEEITDLADNKYSSPHEIREKLERLHIDLQVLGKKKYFRQNPEEEIQGLSKLIHDKICLALTEAQHAISYVALCKNIGLKSLPISPAELGLGRILAYGRNPIYEKKENAVYVLRDWVATETYTKGRIHPDRILTPLKEKSIEFPDSLLSRIQESDIYFCEFGLFNSMSIAKQIAARLPGNPQELFYITQINNRVSEEFSNQFEFLGKNWFGVKLGIPEKSIFETIVQFRYRYLKRSLEQFSNDGVRDKVRDLSTDYPELLALIRYY